MKARKPYITVTISYFFILLFCYAAISKLLDFENFQVQLAQSPLLSAYAAIVSYSVIGVELFTVVLLCFSKTRLLGLYISLGLMAAFTIYIYLILNYSDFIPCSCGGILENMGWTAHLVFNLACILMALVAIIGYNKSQNQQLTTPLLYSGSSIVISSMLVLALFLSSEHIIKKENNFTRRFLLHPIIADKELDLGLNSYYFAGSDAGKIYLGNYTTPLILTVVDTLCSNTTRIKILPDNDSHPFRSLQLQVKEPYFFLYDGSIPIIYRGKLGDTAASTISYKDAYFNQLVVIDSVHFAIRTQNAVNRQYTLASLDLERSPKVQLHPAVLEKQVDGVFDVSGFLTSNPERSFIVYTYAYRNEFIVLDNRLNIVRRLHTIDTTRRAKISVTALSDGSHRMTAPPFKVNKFSTVNGQILFNQSSIMGKHESAKAWKHASIIDLYRTESQEYIGSFYIYHEKQQAMSQILSNGHYLYVLIGNKLQRYRFREPISKYFKAGIAENPIQSRQKT